MRTPTRRRLSIVSASSPPSPPKVEGAGRDAEITFITLPPPVPDRRSPRPNPLRRRVKASSAPAPSQPRRKRARTTATPPASTRVPHPLLAPEPPSRRNTAAPREPPSLAVPAAAGEARVRGLPIPGPLLAHADFARALADLEAEHPGAVAGGALAVPVHEAAVDALWEACTFVRDTAPALKALATRLLRDVLNVVEYTS